WKLVGPERVWSYRPSVASLRCERVFEQQSIVIEQRLNRRGVQWLWLRDRGELGNIFTNLRLNLLVFVLELRDFLVECICLLSAGAVVRKRNHPFGLRMEEL